MGYEQALIAAGAEVLEFKEFGSYQGDWLAKVIMPDQRQGWIMGSYGSCSGCDAFEGEFGYGDEPSSEYTKQADGSYKNWRDETIDQAKFDDLEKAYQARLAAFGEHYFLTEFFTQRELEIKFSKDDGWGGENAEMLEYVKTVGFTRQIKIEGLIGTEE